MKEIRHRKEVKKPKQTQKRLKKVRPEDLVLSPVYEEPVEFPEPPDDAPVHLSTFL